MYVLLAISQSHTIYPLVLATKIYKNIGVPKESEKQKKENEKSLKTESKKEVTFLPLSPAVRIYLLDN